MRTVALTADSAYLKAQQIFFGFVKVELLQFTDSLTLKYLLSNERLDVFCPEVKPKLNYFMEESIRLKKRHGSGEEKFEENFKIPVKSIPRFTSLLVTVIAHINDFSL